MPSPPLLVVEHATGKPSADCAVASALVEQIADCTKATVSLLRLRDRDTSFSQPGSAEHVLAEGRLADNSLLWAERATSSRVRFFERDSLPDAGAESLVIAFNPVLTPRLAAPDLRRRIDAMGRQPHWLLVAEDGNDLLVCATDEGAAGRDVARAERDSFGRWILRDQGLNALWAERFGLPAPLEPTRATPPGRGKQPTVRVVVVGEASHFRDIYPAVLVALGDAADEFDAAIEMDFVSPKDLGRADWITRLAAADGLALPGGSDLGQVDGQIQAASVAMVGGLPTVGLCLGMQSMAVAAARTAAGLPDSNLEEIDPEGPCLLFRRLEDERGRPLHRLGEARIRVLPDTRLADCCREGMPLGRLNHRYALAETFAQRLEAAGLRICARSDDGSVVEGVEISDHPFFIGLQSHPELSSRANAPHPVLRCFLRAAANRRRSTAQGFV